jgi:hypothetical protein
LPLSPGDRPNSNHQETVDAENRGGKINVEGAKTKNSAEETPPLRGPRLGQMMAYFKYQSTKEMTRIEIKNATKFWQRNY